MRTKVVCPDCGPQPHRGHRDQLRKDGDKHEFNRFIDPKDDSCPICCSETLPLAAAESALALHVRVAATGYFEREVAAVEARKDKTRLRENYRELKKDARRLRAVVG